MKMPDQELATKVATVLFLDVAGYSSMVGAQLITFFSKITPRLATIISKVAFIDVNTWGDGIIIVAEDPYALAHIALDLRDFFRNQDWAGYQLPEALNARISLHTGRIFVGRDPIRNIRNTDGVVGTEVNLAARIEPIVRPGEIWVSEQVKVLIKTDKDKKVKFHPLGSTALAKKFGTENLFVLLRADETISDVTKPITFPEDSSLPTGSPDYSGRWEGWYCNICRPRRVTLLRPVSIRLGKHFGACQSDGSHPQIPRTKYKFFPELAPALAACIEAYTAILDREMVYLGRDGRPEF
jgi:class 3 adenylate cyclase